jgi:hypothetical protein
MNICNNAPHWKDEPDWLCTVEFLRKDDPEARVYTSEIIGYLVGYAHLANARTLALLADDENNAYEILFSFPTPAGRAEFLNMVRMNEELMSDYLENDLLVPTFDEILNGRPLAAVLPEDVLAHVTLVATLLCAELLDSFAN